MQRGRRKALREDSLPGLQEKLGFMGRRAWEQGAKPVFSKPVYTVGYRFIDLRQLPGPEA